tara:strand:+ start:757 stop:2565 length:1809 start_codon:yes stop_codon:yes gene_type:complete
MTGRIISPSIEDFSKITPPLNEGEEKVFHLFNNNLDKNWEIYTQPFFNGKRPDFILLNPNVGIIIVEVKDWELNTLKDQQSHNKHNVPVNYLRNLKENIFDMYCPTLAQKGLNAFAAIETVLFYPKIIEDDLKNIYSKIAEEPRAYIFSKDDLDSNNLDKLKTHQYKSSKLMAIEDADYLRSWLVEPEHSIEQRTTIKFDRHQKELIEAQNLRRRVRGPAGSGKSLVLVARACRLASKGKNVLIVHFNNALNSYLRDLSTVIDRKIKNKIEFYPLFQKFKDILLENNLGDKYDETWAKHKVDQEYTDTTLDTPLNEIAKLLINNSDYLPKLYDAILIDEGQNFDPLWCQALEGLLKHDGEMFLAGDHTQDIYEKNILWNNYEKKINSQSIISRGWKGFRGRWFELKKSYRLAPEIADLCQVFTKDFLFEDPMLTISQQTEIPYRSDLKWVQVNKEAIIQYAFDELFNLHKKYESKAVSMTDIYALCQYRRIGIELSNKLEEKNIKTSNTFDDNGYKERKKKYYFMKGSERIKLTTFQSIQGREIKAAIVIIEHASSPIDFRNIYTALTRLKKDEEEVSKLTVVCSEQKLESFGKKWPKFETY